MSFDYKEYSEAMDEFHLKMVQIPQHDHPDNQKAFARICRLLRIAKVDISYYDFSHYNDQTVEKTFAFYEQDDADFARRLTYQEEGQSGESAVYHVYPFLYEEDWSDLERDKIYVLIKMLFVYNDRLHTLKLAEKLIYMDPDLGIYNHSYFLKYCREQINQERVHLFTACYFNLKRFSSINQQLGRKKATEVLANFIHAFQEKLGDDGIVCRIGGDNFIALFHNEHMPAVMDYLRGIGMSYDNATNNKIFITTTAGYYQVTEDIKMPSDVLDNATTAYNLAKNVLDEPFLIFDNKMAGDLKEKKWIETVFPDALEKEEFEVYYQPKVSLKNYTLAGAEALCRWFHNGEMIMPYRFIPILEQSKFVTMLDFYMLEHVCQDLRQWLDEGKRIVKVSVNLSRRHLGDVDLLDRLLTIIDNYRIPHEYIEFELTETTTDVDYKDLRNIVTGLQDLGIHTSVDDFGIGYSSLNLIRELPWNVLKIDKSFLNNKENVDKNGDIMLSHVISMAQEIGLECLVEGVENVDQIKFLKENNCYLAQGFFFDKPLNKAAFESRLNAIQ